VLPLRGILHTSSVLNAIDLQTIVILIERARVARPVRSCGEFEGMLGVLRINWRVRYQVYIDAQFPARVSYIYSLSSQTSAHIHERGLRKVSSFTRSGRVRVKGSHERQDWRVVTLDVHVKAHVKLMTMFKTSGDKRRDEGRQRRGR
jgi:hypothetical protein